MATSFALGVDWKAAISWQYGSKEIQEVEDNYKKNTKRTTRVLLEE